MKTRSMAVAPLAVLGLALGATPAVAAPAAPDSATISVAPALPGVYVDAASCVNVPLNYAVGVPADTTTWIAHTDLTLPDGTVHENLLASSFLGAPTTGVKNLPRCAPLPSGVWTFTPRVAYRGSGTPQTTVAGAPVGLDVQTYTPTFTTKAKKLKNGKWRVRSKLVLTTAAGPVPVAGVTVAVNRKAKQEYKPVKRGTCRTNAKGVCKVKVKLTKRNRPRVFWANQDLAAATVANGYGVQMLSAGEAKLKLKRR